MASHRMMPLSLGVKRGKHRLDDPEREHADRAFASLREEVKKESSFACCHCDFKSKKFQEVHHIDDDHHNNDKSNLACVCPLCHACHHISLSGIKERGCIIYVDPRAGLTQAMLNEIVRRLWIAEEIGDKNQRLSAISRLNRFYKQTVAARRKLGGSEPSFLGDFLLSMEDKDYPNRDRVFQGAYFLPLKDAYKKQLSYWVEQERKSLPADTWPSIAKNNSLKWLGDGESLSDVELAIKLGVRS